MGKIVYYYLESLYPFREDQILSFCVSVDQVAQEVKRIRHIKIDKPSPASQLNLSAATSGSSLNLAASAVGNNLSLGSSTLSLPSAALPTSLSTVPQSLSQPHASQAVDTLVVTEVTCPCCQSKFSDKVSDTVFNCFVYLYAIF